MVPIGFRRAVDIVEGDRPEVRCAGEDGVAGGVLQRAAMERQVPTNAALALPRESRLAGRAARGRGEHSDHGSTFRVGLPIMQQTHAPRILNEFWGSGLVHVS
jgi:hypothetical protein